MIGHAPERYKTEIHTLGIDPSLRGTGICFCHSGDLVPHFLSEKKLRGVHRLVDLRKRLGDQILAARTKPQIAVIENYAYDALNRLADMAEWGGQIKVELFERGIEFVVATPQHLKRFATGNGSASKERVMEWVERKWGLCVDGNDNLADAAVLAKMGEVYLTGISGYRSELEVIKALRVLNGKRGKRSKSRRFRKVRSL